MEDEEGGDDSCYLIIEAVDYSDSDEDNRVIKVFQEGDDEQSCQRLEIVSVNPLQLRPLPPREDPSEEEIDVITCTVWDDSWISRSILEMQAEDEHNSDNDTSDNEPVDESSSIRSNELKRPSDDSLSSEDANPPKKACKRVLKRNKKNDNEESEEENEESEEENEESEEDNEERHDKNDSERPSTSVNEKAENMMINSSVGFSVLIHAFKYLRVYELLRAARVCKMWNFIASHPSFWETVIMKNSMVHDWTGFVRYISVARTKHLSLKKMIGPTSEDSQIIMWEKFSSAISSCSNKLISVDMWRCTPKAFLAMAEASPQLESLVSTAIKAEEIDLLPLKNNVKLKELKVKPFKPSLKIKDFSFLTSLCNLTTLGLTSINNLDRIAGYLPTTLEALELGECSGLSIGVVKNIFKLKLLKRLRLEKGWDNCPTFSLMEAISTLPELHHLELINFEIRPGFDVALSACKNIRFLLIIPTYFTQKATTNSVLIRGLSQLKETLTSVIWVITLELLRTIDLLLEDMENTKSWRKGSIPPKEGRVPLFCIPVIKKSIRGSNQVHILRFNDLSALFRIFLPNTRIRIRRIAYDCTWSQTFFKNERK